MNNIYLFKNAKQASHWVANYFDEYVKNNPNAVLGFATGTTPLLTYKILQEKCKSGTSWKNIKSFNLDEFVGVPVDHPESFWSQMKNNLFVGLDIKNENIFLPNGLAINLEEEANDYERKIDEIGGIDLQYISLGANGHMAYNEPGTPLNSTTHVTKILDFTRKILVEQKKFPTFHDTPNLAITVGVKTIMNFKKNIMVATGNVKAIPAKKMLEGPITSEIPSSILQNHKDTIFVIDEEASKFLDLSKHNVKDMTKY